MHFSVQKPRLFVIGNLVRFAIKMDFKKNDVHDDEGANVQWFVDSLDHHSKNTICIINSTTKSEVRGLKEHLEKVSSNQSTLTNELCDRVNHCAKATGDMKESLEETVLPMCETVHDANARAKSSEQTTRLLLGLLGSQERKRRKVDTDEISRLRNEIGVMKRQSRDKDAQYTEMIGTLSDRVEELLCQMEDMRSENKNREDILLHEMAESKKILALLAARL